MAELALSDFHQTGNYVSADMFGANSVFELTEAGIPTANYVSAAQALGVHNVRFGGGQADLDPTKANSSGNLPEDGVNAINIVEMNGGALRAELVSFLDWCATQTQAQGNRVWN